ncbi:hypothetical protein [Stappia indica]|uniref:hypothetical protein n=1 Tax=Stappia indica TaxID=538381 RepID=UPI001CD7DEE3|nr:hypothetical protein [Stappia indica]MCA1300614.1 hypothetical protein [Stappia indica]
MWVWRTADLLSARHETERFLATIGPLDLSDLYLYLTPEDYRIQDAALQALLARLKAQGTRAWGMDGWRGYFHDSDGPSGLMAALDSLIAFNARHPDTGFTGFHSDLEPQDGQGVGRALFHNGLAASQLTPAQRADRDRLMADWVALHDTLRRRTEEAGLAYGAALPSWLDDYYGEPVTMRVEGDRRPVLGQILARVDEAVIMAYSTRPARTAARLRGELAFARGLRHPPRILFGVETHAGPGPAVSYADLPSKASRRTVLSDIAAIATELAPVGPLSGAAIHDWQGWKTLPP